MKKGCFLAVAAIFSWSDAPRALARGGDPVICESTDNRAKWCRVGWRDARIESELSKTACVRGRNWKYNGEAIWVSGGCRARFVEAGGGGRGGRDGSGGADSRQRPIRAVDKRGDVAWGGYRGPAGRERVVTCGSVDGRYRLCDTNLGRGDRVRLIDNASRTRCEEGRNWGVRRGAIWVDGGCRGRFSVRSR